MYSLFTSIRTSKARSIATSCLRFLFRPLQTICQPFKKSPSNEEGSDVKNCWSISIGVNMSQILSKVIINRLKEAYKSHISEAQFGFGWNRYTTDAICILSTVIEKYEETLDTVYIVLTAAYGYMLRDFLFRVLRLRTGVHHLITILQKMYERATASILGMKEEFDVLVSCRQGGHESPCIFNYYFDYVL